MSRDFSASPQGKLLLTLLDDPIARHEKYEERFVTQTLRCHLTFSYALIRLIAGSTRRAGTVALSLVESSHRSDRHDPERCDLYALPDMVVL